MLVHSELPAGGGKRMTSPKPSSVKKTEKEKNAFPTPLPRPPPPDSTPNWSTQRAWKPRAQRLLHSPRWARSSSHPRISLAHQGPGQIQKLPLPILELKTNELSKLSQAGPKGQQHSRLEGVPAHKVALGRRCPTPRLDGKLSPGLGRSQQPVECDHGTLHSTTAPLTAGNGH